MLRVGASSGDAVGLAWLTLTFVTTLACTPINALKGKYGMAVFSLLGGYLGLIGAVRLAKPGSWCAQRFYGPEKLARAAERFRPQPRTIVAEVDPYLGTPDPFAGAKGGSLAERRRRKREQR